LPESSDGVVVKRDCESKKQRIGCGCRVVYISMHIVNGVLMISSVRIHIISSINCSSILVYLVQKFRWRGAEERGRVLADLF